MRANVCCDIFGRALARYWSCGLLTSVVSMRLVFGFSSICFRFSLFCFSVFSFEVADGVFSRAIFSVFPGGRFSWAVLVFFFLCDKRVQLGAVFVLCCLFALPCLELCCQCRVTPFTPAGVTALSTALPSPPLLRSNPETEPI